ncbi:MAG TPA: peptide chain release factor N(5)-glutamine methyltransferase [Actinomycetota bacterium]|nr:peptide chain release factor N(5)-glutamine methyltransferase [Actinomycetota bacterium]
MSIRDDIDAAAKTFADAGIDTARNDAEWIAAAALGKRRSEVVARLEDDMAGETRERFKKMVARRARREPLAYVVGTVVFRGLELEVGAGCLVPRPETEVTAERAIARARDAAARPTVVDVGTGCGAIALSLAAEVPEARIFATEALGAARGWALRNLARTGLRVTLLPGNLMRPLHPALGGGVDVVVSNPPYVSEEEWDGLETEVRRYEPKEAVVGGDTGLEVILELLEQVRMWLAPGGWLVIEIAESQGERVSRLLGILGYRDVKVTKDLAGRDRVVEARWVGLP